MPLTYCVRWYKQGYGQSSWAVRGPYLLQSVRMPLLRGCQQRSGRAAAGQHSCVCAPTQADRRLIAAGVRGGRR